MLSRSNKFAHNTDMCIANFKKTNQNTHTPLPPPPRLKNKQVLLAQQRKEESSRHNTARYSNIQINVLSSKWAESLACEGTFWSCVQLQDWDLFFWLELFLPAYGRVLSLAAPDCWSFSKVNGDVKIHPMRQF